MNVRRSGSATSATSRASLRFHFWLGEVARELVPERNVGGFGKLENLSGKDALRDEAGFFPEGELGRVEPLHEARKHFLHEAGARSELFCEAVLNETREGVVETVRERKRRPPFAMRAAAAGTDVFEKMRRPCLAAGVSVKAEPTKIPP